MFDLFDLAWGHQNADETQHMIRLAKCERAIRCLYHAGGASLPHHDRHPFRDPMEVVLTKTGVCAGSV
jgi:hypothetical protein